MIIAEWTVNLPKSDWVTAFGTKRAVVKPTRKVKTREAYDVWADWELDLLWDFDGPEIVEKTGRTMNAVHQKRAKLRKPDRDKR